MSFAEVLLKCTNCKNTFTFTVKEHESRAARGFPNEPALCSSCRKARKSSNENDTKTAVRTNQYFR